MASDTRLPCSGDRDCPMYSGGVDQSISPDKILRQPESSPIVNVQWVSRSLLPAQHARPGHSYKARLRHPLMFRQRASILLHPAFDAERGSCRTLGVLNTGPVHCIETLSPAHATTDRSSSPWPKGSRPFHDSKDRVRTGGSVGKPCRHATAKTPGNIHQDPPATATNNPSLRGKNERG